MLWTVRFNPNRQPAARPQGPWLARGILPLGRPRERGLGTARSARANCSTPASSRSLGLVAGVSGSWTAVFLGGHLRWVAGVACLTLAPNALSVFPLLSPASPAPTCFIPRRPAWYDLPPPPYSSDTESLNQADLPPYRSRSGSADSAGSQAASSLLSTEDSGQGPGQAGSPPPESVTGPRDSVPSQDTAEV